MMASRPSILALTRPGPLRLYSTDELLRLEPPQWLIDGILPANGFIGLYGESYTGKSYLALDFALCIAAGLPWHGHAVLKGFVIYIAAEGGHGVRKRVQAWCTLNGINTNMPEIGWLLQSVPIHPTSEEMDTLCARIVDDLPASPVLVVVDTLARCFPLAGNESATEDMGQFVAGVDRLRVEFKSAVMAVHHTRVDNERERGSTAFRGAADTMIVVTKPKAERVRMKCTKQKDFDEFAPITLTFAKVKGESVSLDSAALVDLQPSSEIIVRKALIQAGKPQTPAQLTTVSGLSRSSVMRVLRDTVEKGEIIKEKQYYRLRRFKIVSPENRS